MNKHWNIAVAFLLIVLAFTLYLSNRWAGHGKKELDPAAILQATIYKAFPHRDSTIMLTKQQIGDFVRRWNRSNSVGYNKYQCQYYIEVYLLDSSRRTFCTQQDQILEGSTNGWVFSIGEKKYFDSLYQLGKTGFPKLSGQPNALLKQTIASH